MPRKLCVLASKPATLPIASNERLRPLGSIMNPLPKGQFRFSGSAGFGALAGLTKVTLYGGPAGLGKGAGRALARRFAREAAKKAVRAFARELRWGSRAWLEAFTHIAEHFDDEIFRRGLKAAHGVFLKRFCSKEALEPLLKQAVTRPTRQFLLPANHPANTFGILCVVVEREFADVIGESLVRDAKGEIKRAPAKILRIFLDIRSKPQSAFPAKSFM
jgi:hypothetical protein